MALSQIKGWARSVKSSQRMTRMLAIKVLWSGGVPTVTGMGSTDVTVTDGGTGIVTLTFREAFLREPVVVATPMGTAALDATVYVTSSATTAITLSTFDATDGITAKDNIPLHVIVVGHDAADII